MHTKVKIKLVGVVVVLVMTQALPQYLNTIKLPFLHTSLPTNTLSFLRPKTANTANFAQASVTMGNSRFSYRAGVATGSSGSSVVDIDSVDTSTISDATTNHLFIGDVICFTNSNFSGCSGQTTYTVANIVDTDTFNTTSPLANAMDSNDYLTASQSGILTARIKLTTAIPANGDVLITIPAIDVTGKTNDGMADTAATAATNGFDLGGLGTSNVSVSTSTSGTCVNGDWSVAAVSAGDASNDHTIRLDRSSICQANNTVITITIGDGTKKLINPAPTDAHVTQGVAETYSINIKSRDSGDAILDSSDILVAPVEGVFVSATIDESLSFTVAQVTANSGSYCGVTRTASSPDSTAYSIPWGTLSTTYLAATHNAQQQLTVGTNAANGYEVYIEESDQMGRNGNTCTGTAPSAGDYTFSSGTCIRDTVCDGTGCSQTTLRDWGSDPSTYPGLGYSLEDVTGTDAYFEFDDSAATFNAKQLADIQGSEDPTTTGAEIMSSTGTVSANSAYVCYRIDVPADQPAGFYYNTVKYTATPVF